MLKLLAHLSAANPGEQVQMPRTSRLYQNGPLTGALAAGGEVGCV